MKQDTSIRRLFDRQNRDYLRQSCLGVIPYLKSYGEETALKLLIEQLCLDPNRLFMNKFIEFFHKRCI